MLTFSFECGCAYQGLDAGRAFLYVIGDGVACRSDVMHGK
jgi:hypothetical protein